MTMDSLRDVRKEGNRFSRMEAPLPSEIEARCHGKSDHISRRLKTPMQSSF